MSCVWVLHRGHSGDGCDLASTLCKYDLRKGDFVCSELGKGAMSESLFRSANVLLFAMTRSVVKSVKVSVVEVAKRTN